MSFWSNLSDWWGRANYGPMNESAKQNGLGHYAWTDDRYDGHPVQRFLAATDNPLAYSIREKLGLTSSDGNETQQLLDQVAALQSAEIEQQTQHDKDMFWLGQYSADQAMQFEKEMTDLNWKRQMDASNTAWQRQVEDMKKLVSIPLPTLPTIAEAEQVLHLLPLLPVNKLLRKLLSFPPDKLPICLNSRSPIPP